MNQPSNLRVACLACLMAIAACARASAGDAPGVPARKPNIIFIISDDVGYGDLGCYGATKVKTPNLDRLAATGLRFTDAHSSASTCTPSRYSVMTGEYAWRKKGTGILPGDAALIIPTDRPTLPSLMRQGGYATGCVGKWHLGLGAAGKLDWNGDIEPGPLEVGFDYCYIIPATGDRVPCVFVENHRVAALDPNDPLVVSYGVKVGTEPTGREHPELLTMKPSHGHDDTIVNGISRIGFMTGARGARWKDEQIATELTKQAVHFIEENREKPFFLYFATHDIHVPRVPGEKYRGSSECGVRGDVIQELDGSVGEVIATLDRLKLADDTLIIFSSDNGPVVDDGYADGSVKNLNGHKPAGPLSGGKYSIYEGGTRVPFIVNWPGHVKPGVSNALVCQVDLLASLSAFVKADKPPGAGPDSENVLPALLGESPVGREQLIEQSNGIAIRKGQWKLIPPRPGGGGGKDEEGRPIAKRGPQAAELFNLADDPGEKKNVAAEHPELVQELSAALQKARTQ